MKNLNIDISKYALQPNPLNCFSLFFSCRGKDLIDKKSVMLLALIKLFCQFTKTFCTLDSKIKFPTDVGATEQDLVHPLENAIRSKRHMTNKTNR